MTAKLHPPAIELLSCDGARAMIHPQGAHISAWQPARCGEQGLFTSARAIYAEGVAIRGGVPVIFPQFASLGSLPKHGFARTSLWRLTAQSRGPEGEAQALFALHDSPETLSLWPHRFEAMLLVELAGQRLTVRLGVRNSGFTEFSFTAALHSYLAVSEIAEIAVQGLQGLHYRDSVDGGTVKLDSAERLRVQGEVDRIYLNAPAHLQLLDGAQSLRLAQTGFADTVVWNPGPSLCAGMADLADDDYRRFICIEAAAIAQPIKLLPGREWQGSQTLERLHRT